MCIKCRHMQQQQCSLYSFFLGLARTIYIRCIYGTFGWEITEYTVIYGVYIRLWPTLLCSYQDTAKYGLCHRPFFLYTHKCRIKDLSMAFAFFRSYFHLCTEMLQGCHLCCLLTPFVQRCCRGITYMSPAYSSLCRDAAGVPPVLPPYFSCAEMLQGYHLCHLLTPPCAEMLQGYYLYVTSLLLLCRDAAGVPPVLPPYSSCGEMLQGCHLCCLLTPHVQRCCRGITYMSPAYSSCAVMPQGCHLCCLNTPPCACTHWR